jgi:hypothetical protein
LELADDGIVVEEGDLYATVSVTGFGVGDSVGNDGAFDEKTETALFLSAIR